MTNMNMNDNQNQELWNPESQKVWNPESIGMESGIQPSESGIQELAWISLHGVIVPWLWTWQFRFQC